MGWKAIRDHYRIRHQVAIYEGEGICIGTGYIHNIIVLNPTKKTITTCRSARPPSFSNEDLERYWAEIHSDTDNLWALAAAADDFETSLPVFTYEGGAVVKYMCEEYGWPNVTHCGKMMYENEFFEREIDARDAGIRNAKAGVDALERSVERAEQDLTKRREELDEYRTNLASLTPQQ